MLAQLFIIRPFDSLSQNPYESLLYSYEVHFTCRYHSIYIQKSLKNHLHNPLQTKDPYLLPVSL